MKKAIIGGAVVLVIAVLTLSMGGSGETLFHAELYKDSSCGCCGIYSQYLDRQGAEVAVKEGQTNAVKTEQGIPSNMKSCHTMLAGGYFIEGHVPVEAVQKLLGEKPDVKGIALPGMPSGSPGMPGAKSGSFVVYSIGHDGGIQEFMRI